MRAPSTLPAVHVPDGAVESGRVALIQPYLPSIEERGRPYSCSWAAGSPTSSPRAVLDRAQREAQELGVAIGWALVIFFSLHPRARRAMEGDGMARHSLPERPDLDQLRWQAKELRRSALAGDRDALERPVRMSRRQRPPLQTDSREPSVSPALTFQKAVAARAREPGQTAARSCSARPSRRPLLRPDSERACGAYIPLGGSRMCLGKALRRAARACGRAAQPIAFRALFNRSIARCDDATLGPKLGPALRDSRPAARGCRERRAARRTHPTGWSWSSS